MFPKLSKHLQPILSYEGTTYPNTIPSGLITYMQPILDSHMVHKIQWLSYIMISVCCQFSSCIQLIHSFSVRFGVRQAHSSRTVFRPLKQAGWVNYQTQFCNLKHFYFNIYGCITNVAQTKLLSNNNPCSNTSILGENGAH